MAAPSIDPLPTAPVRSMTAAAFVTAANAWVSALALFVTQVNAVATWMVTQAALIFTGVSAASVLVGTGSKSFTGLTNLALGLGAFVTVARTSAPSNTWMFGQVTAYDPVTGALTVNVTDVGIGTGTFTDWTVTMSGPKGAAGGVTTGKAIAMAIVF